MKQILHFTFLMALTSMLPGVGQGLSNAADEPRGALQLPPGEDNLRYSEGDFIHLKDGRIRFVYRHFTDGADDHSKAYLAARHSSDDGQTWPPTDMVILRNEGDWNIMSVSLLRLNDESIALFYLSKNSMLDC